jgi:hypothetical protein
MITRSQFNEHWLRTGKDPDGNYLFTMIIGSKEDSYNAYITKKMLEEEFETKSYNTTADNARYYRWNSESEACEKCNELNGQIFDYYPQRPHPHCNCEIEEISAEEAGVVYREYKERIKTRDENIDNLTKMVGKESKRECAKYVGYAIEKSFPNYIRSPKAKDCGNNLKKLGFYHVAEGKNYKASKGDIKIYQPYDAFFKDGKNYPASDPAGHMQIFNGEQWISDFKQGETPRSISNKDQGLYPNRGYENSNTSSQIYRHAKWQEWD